MLRQKRVRMGLHPDLRGLGAAVYSTGSGSVGQREADEPGRRGRRGSAGNWRGANGRGYRAACWRCWRSAFGA